MLSQPGILLLAEKQSAPQRAYSTELPALGRPLPTHCPQLAAHCPVEAWEGQSTENWRLVLTCPRLGSTPMRAHNTQTHTLRERAMREMQQRCEETHRLAQQSRHSQTQTHTDLQSPPPHPCPDTQRSWDSQEEAHIPKRDTQASRRPTVGRQMGPANRHRQNAHTRAHKFTARQAHREEGIHAPKYGGVYRRSSSKDTDTSTGEVVPDPAPTAKRGPRHGETPIITIRRDSQTHRDTRRGLPKRWEVHSEGHTPSGDGGLDSVARGLGKCASERLEPRSVHSSSTSAGKSFLAHL